MRNNFLQLLTHTFFTLGVLALLYSFSSVRADETTATSAIASNTQAISYQGQLSDGGVAANGQYDIAATLFDAASGGQMVGSTAVVNDVTVAEGLFSAELPFGSSAFSGGDVWLEIGVRATGGGAFTTLSPRQAIRPAPSAHSVPWNGIADVPADFADGVDNVLSAPLRPGHVDRAIDTTGVTGKQPSIIIGLDGLPIISYFNDTTDDLMVFHCNDLTCASGTRSTVDSNNRVGEYSSITIGRSGFPLISYYDASAGDLKFARCLDTACTTATISTLDTAGNVGLWTSIVTNKNGYAFISYFDEGNDDLIAMSCDNEDCTSNSVWTVDSTDKVGKYTSVMRNAQGDMWISYFDETNGDLKVARCSNGSCANPMIRTVDGNPSSSSGGNDEVVGQWTSITAGSNGYPLIAYARFDAATSSAALVAHCESSSCTTASVDPFISGASNVEFQNLSITLGPDGFGRIVLSLGNLNRAYFIQCSNPACSDNLINDQIIIDSVEDTIVTIGADGYPIIAYHEFNDDELRIVHCSDLSCEPYYRRR